MESPREGAAGGRQFAYFTVRIRVQAPGEPANLASVVERLGAGRKHSSADEQERLRVLADWSHAAGKMSGGRETGNAAGPAAGGPPA